MKTTNTCRNATNFRLNPPSQNMIFRRYWVEEKRIQPKFSQWYDSFDERFRRIFGCKHERQLILALVTLLLNQGRANTIAVPIVYNLVQCIFHMTKSLHPKWNLQKCHTQYPVSRTQSIIRVKRKLIFKQRNYETWKLHECINLPRYKLTQTWNYSIVQFSI